MDEPNQHPKTIATRGPARLPASTEGVHCLCVIAGEHLGSLVRIDEGTLVLGRDPGRDFHLPDPEVSRAHCEVTRVDGRVVVRDLGSTNGTWIDSERVVGERELPLASVLQLGRHVLRCELHDPAELSRHADLARELERARRYVEALILPPIRKGPLRLDWTFVPSATLGGDALGYRWIDDDRLATFVVDVCGHGVSSALHAAAALSALRRTTIDELDLGDPGAVLGRLEQLFPMEEHSDLYFSAWYGVVYRRDRTVRFASAGHPPALVLGPGGRVSQRLATKNPPIGTMGLRTFRTGDATLGPADRLVVFSDGAYELVDSEGRELSLAAFEDLLAEIDDLEPSRIYDAVRERSGSAQLADDFSLLVISPPDDVET